MRMIRNDSIIFVRSGRLFVQFIDGILSGPMSRSNQAYNTLKDLLTNHCHLRCDELSIIFESIFRHLNRDDDDTAAASNINHSLNQVTIRVRELMPDYVYVWNRLDSLSFRNRSNSYAGSSIIRP